MKLFQIILCKLMSKNISRANTKTMKEIVFLKNQVDFFVGGGKVFFSFFWGMFFFPSALS